MPWGRCAGVAGPVRAAHPGRGATPRGHHRAGGDARWRGHVGRARSSGARGSEYGPAPVLRRLGAPGGPRSFLRAPRRGEADPRGPALPPPGGRRPGPGVPVPRLRPSPPLVRRPPRDPLGGRRSDLHREPGAAVPSPPPTDPPARWVRTGDDRGPADVPPTRWLGARGGSSSAVAGAGLDPRTPNAEPKTSLT